MKKKNIISTIIGIFLFVGSGTYMYNQYHDDYTFDWFSSYQGENIDISEIPDYTHQKYVEINNNIPYFDEADFCLLYTSFWTQDFQEGRTQKEYNERYYQEILEVIQDYKDYSVLGHLDLITRYDEAGIYPFEDIKEIVTKILKIVIKDDKGIEVNTSSHRYGLKDLTPSRDILELYKELGGKIITIGSDTHQKNHLGAYIEETKIELRKLGFEYYCTFDKMKPIFHIL